MPDGPVGPPGRRTRRWRAALLAAAVAGAGAGTGVELRWRTVEGPDEARIVDVDSMRYLRLAEESVDSGGWAKVLHGPRPPP